MEDMMKLKSDLKDLDKEIDRLILERSRMQEQLAAGGAKRDQKRRKKGKTACQTPRDRVSYRGNETRDGKDGRDR